MWGGSLERNKAPNVVVAMAAAVAVPTLVASSGMHDPLMMYGRDAEKAERPHTVAAAMTVMALVVGVSVAEAAEARVVVVLAAVRRCSCDVCR